MKFEVVGESTINNTENYLQLTIFLITVLMYSHLATYTQELCTYVSAHFHRQ